MRETCAEVPEPILIARLRLSLLTTMFLMFANESS